jgi:hypothetical protein
VAFTGGSRATVWLGSRRQGVFRGDRNGSSWVDVGLRGHWIHDVLPDPLKPSIVFAVTDVGVMRSVDNGGHWTPVKVGGARLVGVTIRPQDDMAYGWIGSVLYRSRDHGSTWRRVGVLPR